MYPLHPMKAMIHYEQRTRDGHDYTCSTQPEKWGRHTGHDCNTCKKVDVQLKGGRPPKRTKGRGRPKSQEEIEYVASTALTEHMDVSSPPEQDVDPPPEQEVDPSQRALSTPSAISLRSVLNAPVDKTPTMIEQRAATHIIRQMINSGCERATDQDLRLPTGGPVRKYSIHIQFTTQQF